MILFQVTKYKILDYVIEVLFDKINLNFPSNYGLTEISLDQVHKGMHIKEIRIEQSANNRILKGCEVTHFVSGTGYYDIQTTYNEAIPDTPTFNHVIKKTSYIRVRHGAENHIHIFI